MEEDIKTIQEKLKIIESLCTDDCINKSTVIQPLIYAIQNLIARYKELEKYKRIAELTKISCCTAQNCEALNNAIRASIENVKLKEGIENIIKNEKPYIYTINGEEVTREELIKYLFEHTGDHIPRID